MSLAALVVRPALRLPPPDFTVTLRPAPWWLRARTTRALLLALVASACSDDGVGPSSGVSAEDGLEISAVSPSSDVGAISRGLALALADPALRRQLLDDLRDSPFPKNALHLPSYLSSERGARVLAPTSKHSGLSPARILAAARVGGGLELVMPRPMDRTEWRGGDEIVVQGTPLRMAERVLAPPEAAYTVRGESVPFGVFDKPVSPFVVIRPIEWAVPPDPEAARRAAPARTGTSVTTRAFELAALTTPRAARAEVSLAVEDDCDRRTAKTECPEIGTGGPYGITLPNGHTYDVCVSPSYPAAPGDNDYDLVLDACESELAYGFRPRLATAWDDCNLGREPYWFVEKGHYSIPNSVRIFYALSYYFDCGDEELYGHAHLGDSEFIWLDVVKNGSGWKLHGAFLSAHWHASIDESSYYTAGSFAYWGAWGSRPVVWVAEDKHANYRSRSVCDAGAAYADNCDNGSANADVEVLASANLGNRRFPFLDRVTSRTGWDPARGIALTGYEYYWTLQLFYGWYGSRAGASGKGYSEMFTWFGFGN